VKKRRMTAKDVKKSNVAAKEKMGKWVTVPSKSFQEWFSQWLVASMVLRGLNVSGKLPKRIRLPLECVKDQPDGSAILSFEID